MKIERFLAHLEGVRPTGDGWLARCPAHEDRSPSLSIKVVEEDAGQAKILLHCFTGCLVEEILGALDLKFRDLRDGTNVIPAARRFRRKPTFDIDLERKLLLIAEEDLRKGKSLSVEDRARIELALSRLDSVDGSGG